MVRDMNASYQVAVLVMLLVVSTGPKVGMQAHLLDLFSGELLKLLCHWYDDGVMRDSEWNRVSF
jgi:hypothetical protein